MSSPIFFAEKNGIVKMDKGGKIRKTTFLRQLVYVNQDISKKRKITLWKRLWKMWKTLHFQQSNRSSPQAVENVKWVKKMENPSKNYDKKRVMSLETSGVF